MSMQGSSYRFRLERVRALRERREDEAKLDLAGALMREHQCKQQLDAANAQILAAREAQACSGTSAGADLIARQAYLERIERTLRSSEESLRLQEQAVAGRRDALSQAAQDRQALERLKAKGLSAHRREEARIESVTLDEIATNAYRRRAA